MALAMARHGRQAKGQWRNAPAEMNQEAGGEGRSVSIAENGIAGLTWSP